MVMPRPQLLRDDVADDLGGIAVVGKINAMVIAGAAGLRVNQVAIDDQGGAGRPEDSLVRVVVQGAVLHPVVGAARQDHAVVVIKHLTVRERDVVAALDAHTLLSAAHSHPFQAHIAGTGEMDGIDPDIRVDQDGLGTAGTLNENRPQRGIAAIGRAHCRRDTSLVGSPVHIHRVPRREGVSAQDILEGWLG